MATNAGETQSLVGPNSLKNGELPAPLVEWRQSNKWRKQFYDMVSLLSLGVLPLVAFFDPVVKIRYTTIPCEAFEADHIIAAFTRIVDDDTIEIASSISTIVDDQNNTNVLSSDSEEDKDVEGQTSSSSSNKGSGKVDKNGQKPTKVVYLTSPVQRLSVPGKQKEILLVVELETVRYCASSLDGYVLYKLSDVPFNFSRFLKPLSERDNSATAINERRIQRDIMRLQYGPNKITVPETNVAAIALRWALNPLMVFEYFAAIVWIIEDYWIWSVFLLGVTLAAVYFLTIDSMHNLERLRELAGQQTYINIMTEDGTNQEKKKTINASDETLVPGDIFVVPIGVSLSCDAVLLEGRAIVDESMLTGESLPISKTPIELVGLTESLHSPGAAARSQSDSKSKQKKSSTVSEEVFDLQVQLTGEKRFCVEGVSREIDINMKRPGNVLFGGTKVKAVVGNCIAVCYRSGFRSTKGQLVASLLQPKDSFLLFFADIVWIIVFMFFLTTLIYIYEAYALYNMGASYSDIVLKYFDALTVAIPITLIVALAVTTALANGNLKKKSIYVSDTSKINWSGMVSVTCFDKTGTLTEEALDFKGASVTQNAVTNSAGAEGSTDNSALSLVHFGANETEKLPPLCQEVMATCHSLSLLISSEPVGDPLEVELLRASGWTLGMLKDGSGKMWASPRGSSSSQRYNILRHFEFSPDRLRAATLLQRPSGEIVYLLKGSPEIIARLCKSTVPEALDVTLAKLARRGLRVLAMAYKVCSDSASRLQSMTQDEIEDSRNGGSSSGSGSGNNITFLGLVYLTSKLKQATVPTIESLVGANISVSMVTGDHVHTAVAVASQCGILRRKDGEEEGEGEGEGVGVGGGEDGGGVKGVTKLKDQSNQLIKTGREDTIYIIDESDSGDETLIIDGATDQILTHMPLERVLDAVAVSSYLASHPNTGCRECCCPFWRYSSDDNNNNNNNADDDDDDCDSHSHRCKLHRKGAVELAVTGRGMLSVQRHYPRYIFNSLVRYTKVFARTKPEGKKKIVEEMMATPDWDPLFGILEDLSVYTKACKRSRRVGGGGGLPPLPVSLQMVVDNASGNDLGNNDVLFCGDGGNDMLALRACTVGVSLCDTETSVAAPVTSRLHTPGSVIDLLLEGRCSLILTYTLVHFNIMNAIIQLFETCLFYEFGLQMSQSMYIVQGVFYSLFLMIAIIILPNRKTLSTELPPKRYFVKWLMAQLIPQVILFPLFQMAAIYLLQQQDFYVPYEADDATLLTTAYSYEGCVIDNVVLGQYMISAIVSNIGAPYRDEWYENWLFVTVEVMALIFLLYQIFTPGDDFSESILTLEPIPTYFGYYLVALLVVNAIVSYAFYWLADIFKVANRRTSVACHEILQKRQGGGGHADKSRGGAVDHRARDHRAKDEEVQPLLR